jgi:hypothetical protein
MGLFTVDAERERIAREKAGKGVVMGPPPEPEEVPVLVEAGKTPPAGPETTLVENHSPHAEP